MTADAIRVGVFGAGGKMGSIVCRAIVDDPRLALVGACDPHHVGFDVRQVTGADVPGLRVDGDASAFVHNGVDVVVDFTHLEAARVNLAWCADNGVHAVVGTSGFTEADLQRFADRFAGADAPNAVIAPNFAIGAVLMIRFAELAAPYFDTADIVELHHDNKIDAPSGTATHTAERIAAASPTWAPDPTRTVAVEGSRGGEAAPGVRVHSLRVRGMVAHQEVLLGTMGQTLSIRHDSYDRSSFMPGVVLAVTRVAETPGLTVGLDALLDL